MSPFHDMSASPEIYIKKIPCHGAGNKLCRECCCAGVMMIGAKQSFQSEKYTQSLNCPASLLLLAPPPEDGRLRCRI